MRLHAERGLTIDVDVAPDLSVNVEREDLDEMLGNLLDNACKWAKARVALTASSHQARTVITIDDDGPGIDESMRDAVLHLGRVLGRAHDVHVAAVAGSGERDLAFEIEMILAAAAQLAG